MSSKVKGLEENIFPPHAPNGCHVRPAGMLGGQTDTLLAHRYLLLQPHL